MHNKSLQVHSADEAGWFFFAYSNCETLEKNNFHDSVSVCCLDSNIYVNSRIEDIEGAEMFVFPNRRSNIRLSMQKIRKILIVVANKLKFVTYILNNILKIIINYI